MEPEESLAVIERTVRRAVRLILPNWQEKVAEKDLASAANSKANEERKRTGVEPQGDLLDYMYTKPLFDLVRNNPAEFERIFPSADQTNAFLDFVVQVRNTTAHVRELVKFERDMFAGIAGHLTNLVSQWETRNDDVARHYPIIASVRDSFGRDADQWTPGFGGTMRVEVGQTVEIAGQAVEARGKGVRWFLGVARTPSDVMSEYQGAFEAPRDATPVSVESTLRHEFTFEEEHVGEAVTLHVIVASTSKHHRHTNYDDSRFLRFAVNPPQDD